MSVVAGPLTVDFTTGAKPSTITATRAGGSTVYTQTSASTVVSTTGAAIIENRGNGWGEWTFPAFTQQIAGSSFNFANASWNTQGTCIRTANSVVAPDGTTTATALIDNDAAANCAVYQTIAGSAAGAYSSMWIRDDAGTPPTLAGLHVWHNGGNDFGTGFGTGNTWRRISFGTLLGSFYSLYPAGYTQNNGYGNAATATGTSTGGIDAWGASAVSIGADVPLAPAGSTAATMQLTSPATAQVIVGGDLDVTACFMGSYFDSMYANSGSTDFYAWSGTGTGEGDMSLRFAGSNGVSRINTWTLAIRGADVGTMAMGTPDLETEACIRTSYRPSTSTWRMRAFYNGGIQTSTANTTGATAGGALAAPTSFYLGSNLGATVLPARWTRFTVNPTSPPATLTPEGVIIGDSISEWYVNSTANSDRKTSLHNLIYNITQARTRPGIVSIAHHADQINDQKTIWDAAPYKTQTTLKWVILQVGINNIILGAQTAATMTPVYQALVNDVRASTASIKIICEKLIPAGSYLTGAQNTEKNTFNTNLAGTGPTPITGCDSVLSTPATDLDNGSGVMATKCNSAGIGDGVHPNSQCQRIIAADHAANLTSMGLLP